MAADYADRFARFAGELGNRFERFADPGGDDEDPQRIFGAVQLLAALGRGEEALAERMALLRERLDENALHLEDRSFYFAPDAEEFNHTIEFQEFSDAADHAFSTTNVWFGLPKTQGLKLASVNEGLGAYFKTDHGVLVLEAKEDNAYRLEAGDVIVTGTPGGVGAARQPPVFMDEGDEIEVEVKPIGSLRHRVAGS